MAKMIKCPTCGTQIEVPPQASGQIVKCPGCGKGLKLVAKSKSPSAGQQGAGAGLPGGSVAGGSVAGSSVSAMTFVGDVPPVDRPGANLDDLPSLDSNCAVCGRATDPNDLIEDNGRLVCPDCVKGARSSIERPAGGAEMIDFAPSSPMVRRGPLIQITPSFIGGSVAALIFVALSIVLHLELVKKPAAAPKPKDGTQSASAGAGGAAAVDLDTGERVDGGTATAAPAAPTSAPTGESPVAVAPTPPPDATAAAPPGTDATATPGTPTAAPGTTNPIVALAPTDPDQKTIFTDAPPADGAAPPAPAVVPAAPETPPPPTITSNDPLERGMERLMARDFAKAAQELDSARRQYVVNKMGATLTPQQQQTLEGLAAAYIGQGRYELARGPIDAAYSHGVRSRSITLNSAIVMINSQQAPAALKTVAGMVRNYMASQQGDEFAADIFGTLVNKMSALPSVPKEEVAEYWQYLDQYVDQLAQKDGAANPNAGKLKWGVDWLPAEDVKAFRQARGVANAGGTLQAAAKEADAALAKRDLAEKMLQKAVDKVGAQKQLDAANAALAEAQKKVQAAGVGLNYKKPRWLTEFEPAPVTQ
jgi:hypothetical protein